jgi:ubiquinone/menaquinone biosynthesis C-methylase UbiE
MTKAARARFDKLAMNFATSEVHSDSPTMQRLHSLLELPPQAAVCDVACGPGHLALSFAERATRIVGVDPAPNMLETFRELASARGTTVETVHAYAESIPLPSESFDAVVSRLAPHHFANCEAAAREMARLAKPKGVVAVIDFEGHEDPEIDEFNHRLELLRDPTHVRSYTSTRWREMFQDAGLVVEALESKLCERPAGVSLQRWCEIASSGSVAELQIRSLLADASPEIFDALDIRQSESEYYFPVRTVLILGRKALRTG